MHTVHELAEDDWARWRDLRLRAVSDSPDAFRATFEEESSRADEEWRAIIAATAEHDRGNAWIVEQDGQDVGMAFARIDPALSATSIAAMWVAPQARGRGVGTALLNTAAAWGKGQGASIAELWVTESNADAIGFYESQGFVATNETDWLRPGSKLTVRKLTRPV